MDRSLTSSHASSSADPDKTPTLNFVLALPKPYVMTHFFKIFTVDQNNTNTTQHKLHYADGLNHLFSWLQVLRLGQLAASSAQARSAEAAQSWQGQCGDSMGPGIWGSPWGLNRPQSPCRDQPFCSGRNSANLQLLYDATCLSSITRLVQACWHTIRLIMQDTHERRGV